MNLLLAHLFMICSNIKLTGPAESIGIQGWVIHEQNQAAKIFDFKRAVMAGLVPAIHAFRYQQKEDVMPGTSPGMTRVE